LVLVYALPCVVIAFCVGMLRVDQAVGVSTPMTTIAAMFGLFALALVASLLYPILSEHRVGRTIGKNLFGLRVVTEKGTRIGLGQAIVRQLPVFLQVFTIDALFALFTDRRQRAFEMLSKTRVVDVGEPERAHE